jgi:hypothetical protein
MDFLPVKEVVVPTADARVKEIADSLSLLQQELLQAKETAKKIRRST